MDSGASCSVIQKDHVSPGKIKPAAPIKLMNADGSGVSPIGNVEIQVKLGGMETSQAFVVVDKLSAPAILGCDFLKRFHVFIDFGDSSFGSRKFPDLKGQLLLRQVHLCNLVLDNEYPQAIPHRTETSESELDMPTDYHPSLESTIKKHSSVFRKKLGHTNVTQHIIDTGNSQPIKVPPRPIPFHFADRVHAQLEEMSNEGIIRPSSSPWCAPAVYVPKDNGEVRICVDFVQLNKTTKKDSYPVPRADGPQQKLANKTVFSKIDLRSAYWQFPMDSGSIEKTAFCPGPGYGLWEFTVMPYGLTNATQTCQRGLDKVLKECKDCVDNYVDDCIIFSDNMETHVRDVHRVLDKLQEAGFTLRGSKCFFGKQRIDHLGFEYSQHGVGPTKEKTQAILEWPTPTSPKEVRSFLGLANFYRRFIHKFADIASPLNELTGNNTTFSWNESHQQAFDHLKQALSSPPVMSYPTKNDRFVLTTDASDDGLGAILSTHCGNIIEFASRTLTSAEKNYATIEKECLAIVWAIHKFRHYLIGAHFIIHTDHKPLEWLESSKASRAHSQRLERWSLELRAYDFEIVHRPGNANQNADALSRRPIALLGMIPPIDAEQIIAAQKNDATLSSIYELIDHKSTPPNTDKWRQFPFKRFRQLWTQLVIHQSILCRKQSSPTMTDKYLIVVPQSLQKTFLRLAHDESGHQGIDRTLSRLLDIAYWVGMSKSVVRHCTFCVKCQQSKAPPTNPAPLQPIIATQPWEMVAVDVLKVPTSIKGNQYLLVVQDYFSKWPFAFPMQDQKAETIVQILRDNIFTVTGPPQKLHSDQGRNFESHIMADLCKAFGVKKSRTTPYHPMGDGLVERMNRSLLTLLRTYVEGESLWEEHLQLLLFIYRTTRHSSTGFSPYEILFGSNPHSSQIPVMQSSFYLEPSNFCENLKAKLAQLRELVDANLVHSASQQQRFYRSNQTPVPLACGQQVLLDNPSAGKLDPRWSGPWIVKELRGPSSVLLLKGGSEKLVHMNRVRPLLTSESEGPGVTSGWSPPMFNHVNDPSTITDVQSGDPSNFDEGSPFSGSHLLPGTSAPAVSTHDEQSNSSDPQIVTRSGRTVKPPQRYGT